jgi:hypothetical protein
VIVVIGSVAARLDEAGVARPSGFAAAFAQEAAAAGSKVELVSRLGDDAHGDAVLLAFARTGVGHVATLRDAGMPTPIDPSADFDKADGDDRPGGTEATPGDPSGLDAADVGLALRYLTDYRVVVLAHPSGPEVVREASAAADWTQADLIVVVPEDRDAAESMPEGSLVIAADRDSEATARLLGRYAAAVDSGELPDTAYDVLTRATTDS